MGLETYWKKRDFSRTPEPEGEVAKGRAGFSYLVQKHAASHLHYDFRLELDGVLLSWAVPKGPSLDPADKRLAMQTEDHPIGYGDFEGVIPKGEYGGGTVALWDRGTWEPVGDPRAGLKKGKLDFVLHGEKLRGGFVLVRSGGRRGAEDGRKWLLLKRRDPSARPGSRITEEQPNSVASGRSIEEIARDSDRVWRSNRPAASKSRKLRAQERIRVAARAAKPVKSKQAKAKPEVEGGKPAEMPAVPAAEAATLVSEPPRGDGWLHEIKLDGYRILARLDGGRVQLFSRNGKDWTGAFPRVAEELAALAVENAVLDGEIVALDAQGKSSFQLLQNARDAAADRIVYYVFDLLHLDGVDLRGAKLDDRKALLARILSSSATRVRYNDHVVGRGDAFFARACEMGVEGIVSKRRDSTYVAARTRDWLKVKCTRRQEFVIGGWTDPSGSRQGLGALLLGAHDETGQLRYVGKVGTGFSGQMLRDLLAELRPTERETPAFANPPRGAEARGVHWVEPKLVAEVAFAELTSDRILRHPSFQGLRADKAASEVKLELPQAPPKPAVLPRVVRGKHGGPIAIAGAKITNPERVLYPDAGITKQQIAAHYVAVADFILPHVVDRPLTLLRCPEGWQGECFFQKHLNRGVPEGVRTVGIREREGKQPYLVIDDLRGLLGIVNTGAREIHVWGSRADRVEQPDRIVIDLDPDLAVSWERLAIAALEVRERLAALGLRSFLKTTGGKGLHVVTPFRRRNEWPDVSSFAKGIADAMVHDTPRAYVATVSKAARKDRIFVDYLRNARGATAIAPWSTRARAGAPIAVPLEWTALAQKERPALHLPEIPAHLAARKRDPWADFEQAARSQSLTAEMRKKLGLR